MRRKIPVGITLALMILSIGATFVVTTVLLNTKYNKVISGFSARSQEYEYLAAVDEIVRNNYCGEVNEASVGASTAAGYISGLGDGDCMFLTADEYSAYKLYTSGRMAGTGISGYYDFMNSCITVSAVARNSSAEALGIREGCRITAVGTTEVTEENSEKLLSKLMEETEGEVKITCVSAEGEDPKEVKLTLGYNGVSVEYSVNSGVGYVRISAFYDDTVSVFKEALSFFDSAAVSGIVIDLRNTSGSDFETAAEITDILVPVATKGHKAIGVVTDKNGNEVSVFSSDAESISLPVCVLMNDRTSGAAELIAADLSQFGKATLIGENTAGNAKVQTVFELSDGNALVLVTGVVSPYIGNTYDGKGITPDNEIVMSAIDKNTLDTIATTSSDTVFAAAVETLKGSN